MNPEPAGVLQLQELITRIINIVVALSFIALTVVLFYGGIRFIMSRGEPKNLEAAREMIIWAIFGIVFLALAWLILLLIKVFTGVEVTKFCIGFKPFCP